MVRISKSKVVLKAYVDQSAGVMLEELARKKYGNEWGKITKTVIDAIIIYYKEAERLKRDIILKKGRKYQVGVQMDEHVREMVDELALNIYSNQKGSISKVVEDAVVYLYYKEIKH